MFQDPPSTLNWRYVVGPNSGYVEGLGPRLFPSILRDVTVARSSVAGSVLATSQDYAP